MPEAAESGLSCQPGSEGSSICREESCCYDDYPGESEATQSLEDAAVTMQSDVMTAIRSLDGRKQFDYIFMDPPYDHSLERQVLELLREHRILRDDAW